MKNASFSPQFTLAIAAASLVEVKNGKGFTSKVIKTEKFKYNNVDIIHRTSESAGSEIFDQIKVLHVFNRFNNLKTSQFQSPTLLVFAFS